ncbi:hypothetical protein AKUA2003_10790 [Apilactobacillus kunkeei]|nr:hypothetical protein AKUA1001_10820 [Apilactobacillus kunkeei]CAI2630278.1 hypothetical protein AKUA2003_10790 [Apilactobacillus kunkeei]CAI2802862.1 hypothetical protein AKUA2002_10810 [Apilactobacillus kunkeei]
MINAKKVLATFAVLLTLGGTVSSLASVENSNVTAHAAKKHAKKHVKKVNHKTSKATFYHVASIYNNEIGGYTTWSPMGDPSVYQLNLPYNKYTKDAWHSDDRPVKANYKELQKSVKMNIKKWTTLDPYIYGNQKRFNNLFVDKICQVYGYGQYVGAMQKNIIPLLKNRIDKKDYSSLSTISKKINRTFKDKKYKKLLYYANNREKDFKITSHDKKMYKQFSKNWELNKEYLRVLSKVFGYLKY